VLSSVTVVDRMMDARRQFDAYLHGTRRDDVLRRWSVAAGKLGRSKVGLGKLGLGKPGSGKVGR